MTATNRPSERAVEAAAKALCANNAACKNGGFSAEWRDGANAYMRDARIAVSAYLATDETIAALRRRVEALTKALRFAERHCPCGARPESLDTHPHVPGCQIDAALRQVGTEGGR
jgi:hypothetical protein